ncbi:Omp28-related outer membrane protein [Zavarzinella formosa]|uniref:Omp28-related outer membrane protein n=1 Tax=Zavarzinella formosa TaxID=360055 RepID=UPI0002E42AAD|nr:Omp28-related outer membrane protein [Zavarzinella formosa]
MLRYGALLSVLFVCCATAAAADNSAVFKDGNWRLGYGPGPTGEQPIVILKVETKDGKSEATPVAFMKDSPFKFVSFSLKGDTATVDVKVGTRALSFTGKLQADGKSFRGTFGDDKLTNRGYFTATEGDKLDNTFFSSQPKPPETFLAATRLMNSAASIKFKARQTKDIDEKAELMKKAAEAQEKADAESPDAWRAVITAEKNSPYAVVAALQLIQAAGRIKADPKEVAGWISLVETEAGTFGSKITETTDLSIADTLGDEKNYSELAMTTLDKVVGKLTDKDPLPKQSRVLKVAMKVQQTAGKKELLKATTARYEAVETTLDKEYLANTPPFKVTKAADRPAGQNRAVLMELFTGAQCPPCVAADVAFDALSKTYDHKDVILLQYHMHIPGPDPMTNADTVARFSYYGELFPKNVRGTPTSLFNGKIDASSGGLMEHSEEKFKDYRKAVDTRLDAKTDIALGGKVSRSGETLKIDVTVDGVKEPKDLKLRVVVTEDTIHYVGGNALRYHHHVVRHFVGGVAGTEIKEPKTAKSMSLDLAQIKGDLTKYQEKYTKTEKVTFANAAPGMDTSKLKVVVFVQDDSTGEVLNAVQLEVPAK